MKTVYILGAGFSTPAGGLDQSRLLDRIFSLNGYGEKTFEAKRALADFLVDVMNIDPDKLAEVSLEDIYTPIDRCLADGLSFRDYTPVKLQELRGKIEYLISLAIDRAFIEREKMHQDCRQYVNRFAEYLVESASFRAEKAKDEESADKTKSCDPFSVISLNWDILLDNAINNALRRKDQSMSGDYEPFGVVDYCCYISSLENDEPRIRSEMGSLRAGGYAVKLIKIHGSMNWLQCSHCQQLFMSFDEKLNIPNYINARFCSRCTMFGVDAKLQGSMVMPTFLKDLSNFQIKLVWQNATVELMEADRLVFIGYSLPHADFEFRQLLSRMVSKDAKIEVILYHDSSPESVKKYEDECKRYQQFFGAREITTSHEGVVDFVTKFTTAPTP
jgi:NAD-dependent SIR2 family protein deacetylase